MMATQFVDGVNQYELLSPRKIVFGWGRRGAVGELSAQLGKRAFLVSGSRTLQKRGVLDEISESLRQSGVEPVVTASISREPEVDDVDTATAKLAARGIRDGDFLLAIGGGSAIDLAKAVAAMATNQQSKTVRDYLEGVGRGLQLEHDPLPLLAMPTTAGTGTEATKNAVISCYDPLFKKSLRSELMVPRVVLIDPELAVTAPPSVTAHTGMDAITQLIESYISNRAKPIPRALCLHGLELAIPSIVTAVEDGQCRAARESMAHAALLSGMALANSGLGLAHGVAAALGVHAKVPHGLACAVMLPVAMRVNRDARLSDIARLGRLFADAKRNSESGEFNVDPSVTGDDESMAGYAVEFISNLCARVNIPQRLSEIGVAADQLPAIVQSSRGNSMSGNPRNLSDDELQGLLEGML